MIKYVAYIDESGDPGISRVRPIDPDGSSEWFVLSCFLVRAENDIKSVGWVKEILGKFKNVQSPYLHFADLLPVKKQIACHILSEKPCRLFVAMSNKKNIRQYRNPNLDDGNKSWLYWWLMRLLLERVTDFCERMTPPDKRGASKLSIIFSRRGGMKYMDFRKYVEKLHNQSLAGTLVIDHSDLRWSVIDFEEIYALSHKERAGLQLADVVASAFFQSVENNRPPSCDPTYAKILRPRMAVDRYHRILDCGIKTMPSLQDMDLLDNQKEIFEFYNYNKNGW